MFLLRGNHGDIMQTGALGLSPKTWIVTQYVTRNRSGTLSKRLSTHQKLFKTLRFFQFIITSERFRFSSLGQNQHLKLWKDAESSDTHSFPSIPKEICLGRSGTNGVDTKNSETMVRIRTRKICLLPHRRLEAVEQPREKLFGK